MEQTKEVKKKNKILKGKLLEIHASRIDSITTLCTFFKS